MTELIRSIVLSLLALLAAAGILLAVLFSGGYERTIALNWDLELPRSSGCLYETDSGASFHGDGLRYHVLEYAPGSGLAEALERQTAELSPADCPAEAIWEELSVPMDWRPNPEACRCFTKEHPTDPRNTLCLLLSADGTRLYAAESFL